MGLRVSQSGSKATLGRTPGTIPVRHLLRRRHPVGLARALWRKLRPEKPSGLQDSDERGAEWYDGVFADARTIYHVHYSQSPYYFIWTVIVDRIPRSASVLEVGCGTGQLAAFLSDRGIARYAGFDFSARAVAAARQRSPNLEFHVADARETALLEDAAYDTVVCTEVLEHIEADLEVVRRIRPGTRCLLTVPNFPYPSHVRFFADPGSVSARYGSLFGTHDVVEFLKNPEGDRFFLLDGIRGGG